MGNLKQLLKHYMTPKLVKRRYYLRTGRPNWTKILAGDKERWQTARIQAAKGPKILLATCDGARLPVNTLESLLAVALTLRGAEAHVLLCDSVMPACLECLSVWYNDQKRFVMYGPSRDLCKDCFTTADKMYRSLGIPTHRYSDLITPDEMASVEEISSSLPANEIGSYVFDGMAIGEHALAGALRYFARGTLDGERYAEPVLRRYLKASLITACVTRRLIREYGFSSAVSIHGIYVPHGVIGEVARREKIRVVAWNRAYRKQCFLFSHGDTYHHTLMTEPTEKWENVLWTPKLEAQLLDYLKSRWYGTRDWIWFHEYPEENLSAIAREVGVDFTKPCIGLLTNVVWDAQLHYPANAFPNMIDWLLQTIAYFASRPDLQLIIRVHPAEIRGTVSRQPAVEEIRRAFPVLPDNIFLIPPGSRVSTYAVMSQCNAVIIYGTKTGVELTSMGIPVIVAGEAWIRNKGVTLDANSPEDYFKILDQLPLQARLDNATVERARKYAYHFFFRRMIPLEFVEQADLPVEFKIRLSGIDQLLPGKSKGLDIICSGIINGADFIYPAENMI
ncbi:MAG: capsule biosynthesis protein [Bacillota bacterium]